jgi:hypothetical protein
MFKINNTIYQTKEKMPYPFFTMIPIPGKHGGIVIGKGGRYLDQLGIEFGVKISNMPSQPERKRPTPYFLIESYFEKNINMASIKVYELIVKSMTQANTKLASHLSDLGQESQHTNLVLAEKDETIIQLKYELEGKGKENISTTLCDSDSDSDDNIIVVSE